MADNFEDIVSDLVEQVESSSQEFVLCLEEDEFQQEDFQDYFYALGFLFLQGVFLDARIKKEADYLHKTFAQTVVMVRRDFGPYSSGDSFATHMEKIREGLDMSASKGVLGQSGFFVSAVYAMEDGIAGVEVDECGTFVITHFINQITRLHRSLMLQVIDRLEEDLNATIAYERSFVGRIKSFFK